MARRKSLAEELAELATPAPAADFDPEAGDLAQGAQLDDFDEDVLPLDPRSPGGERLPLFRGPLDLDDDTYKGRRASRKSMFGEEGEDRDNGSSATDHGRGSDKDDTDGPTSANSEDLVVDEAPQSAGEEREAGLDTKRRGSPSRDASGLHDDPKLARLETEAAAAAESDDGVGFADLRQRRAAAEAARGLGVRKQRAMWERLLELRILLQKPVTACARLPRPPHSYAAAAGHSSQLRGGLEGATELARALLTALLELQEAIARNAVEPAAVKDIVDQGSRQKAPLDVAWAQLQAAYVGTATFRNASLDRWHRRTMLASGIGARASGLKALAQTLSNQVAAAMHAPGKLVERTQPLLSEAPRVLCYPSSAAPKSPSASPGAPELFTELVSSAQRTGGSARDNETYDDGEFYQQLLKEFLEGSVSGAFAVVAASRGKRKRRHVERRASKGRKLRYDVHEKLVGFMPPSQAAPALLAPQLFKHLFGHNSSKQQAN